MVKVSANHIRPTGASLSSRAGGVYANAAKPEDSRDDMPFAIPGVPPVTSGYRSPHSGPSPVAPGWEGCPRLDIIGMGCAVGPFTSLDRMESAVYSGQPALVHTPDRAIGEKGEEHNRPVIAAAEQALEDAGCGRPCASQDGPSDRRIAVIMAAEASAGATICSRWNLTGPVIDVSGQVAGAGIEAAQHLLCDQPADLDTVLICDAGAAIVIRPGARAATGQRRVYASIDALMIQRPVSPSGCRPAETSSATGLAGDALAIARVRPEQVEYVELALSGSPRLDEAALSELTSTWPAELLGDRRTAIGWSPASERSSILLSVIKVALCLHHSYLPAWTGPQWAERPLLDGSAFYLAEKSRPWVRPSAHEPLHAAVSTAGESGRRVHLVLSGATLRGEVACVDWTRADGPTLLLIDGDGPDELAERIGRAQDALGKGADQRRLGRSSYGTGKGSRRAVVCAESADSMQRELEAVLTRLRSSARASAEWVSPAGSCYSPSPIGPDGRVALVFPGMLTVYPGLGSDLCRCFPGLIPLAEARGDRIARLSRAGWLYPRRGSAVGGHEGVAGEELFLDPSSVAEVATSYAAAQTQVLRTVLGIPVHGALGYSLGEISMVCSLADRAPYDGGKSFHDDDLFTDWLGGPKRAVRQLWGVADHTPDKAVWASRILFTDAQTVRDQVARYDRVFVTHVNTHNEVIIAGHPEQCRSVVKDLDCPSIPSTISYVLHCPLPEAAQLAERIRTRIPSVSQPTDGVELFSTHNYDRIDVFDAERVSAQIAETLRATVDFPRLVEAVYQRGYRYFIEVGPGKTCTRLIEEVLAGRPHVAVSIDRRASGSAGSTARVLSRLTGHGVLVNLPGWAGELSSLPRGSS
jgi:PfaB family protein